MTYGTETVKLNSTQDRVRITYIRQKTTARNVVLRIMTGKLKWAGHVANFEDDRWSLEKIN